MLTAPVTGYKMTNQQARMKPSPTLKGVHIAEP